MPRRPDPLSVLAIADVPGALLDAWGAIDPASIVEDETGIRTVIDLCRAWYATQETRKVRALSKHTLDIYRRSCEYIRDAKLGSRVYTKVSGPDIAAFVEEMASPACRAKRTKKIKVAQDQRGQTAGPLDDSKGYGDKTINQAIVVLSIVLKWARNNGYQVPAQDLGKYKITPEEGARAAGVPQLHSLDR